MGVFPVVDGIFKRKKRGQWIALTSEGKLLRILPQSLIT
jgi:hypothetical protein